MLNAEYQNSSSPTPQVARPKGMSLAEVLASHFRSHPNRWIDGKTLASIAGGYAWRTRVSDLRRGPFFMLVSNRQRRVETAVGKRITISEYLYTPGGTRPGNEGRP